MDNVKDSIIRAQKLLETPYNDEKYVSIKIKPISGGCCCFHCWPHTWEEVNSKISRYGILEDEGGVLIGDGNERFVLECHESGPEIIAYLGVGIATAHLILDIILALIKNRQHEKYGAQFKITKRVIKNTKTVEENVVEVDFPISKENIKLLNTRINDILSGHDS